MDPIANGLFDISPGAYDNARRRTDLATVQARLAALGYSLAGGDGIMDPTTARAIRSFEASNNLPVTGTVTSGLVENLTESTTD